MVLRGPCIQRVLVIVGAEGVHLEVGGDGHTVEVDLIPGVKEPPLLLPTQEVEPEVCTPAVHMHRRLRTCEEEEEEEEEEK